MLCDSPHHKTRLGSVLKFRLEFNEEEGENRPLMNEVGVIATKDTQCLNVNGSLLFIPTKDNSYLRKRPNECVMCKLMSDEIMTEELYLCV